MGEGRGAEELIPITSWKLAVWNVNIAQGRKVSINERNLSADLQFKTSQESSDIKPA